MSAVSSGGSPTGPSTGRPAGPRPRRWDLPRRTRVLLGAGTVGLIVVGGVVGGLTRSPAPADRVSDRGPAPSFRLTSVEHPDEEVGMADLKGKPAVLNFWGSWCTPCRQELPVLAAAARREAGHVRFLGVDMEDTRTSAAAMLARYGVPYDSAFDPRDSTAPLFLLRGTPTTIFLDSRGHMVGRVDGALTGSRLDWWLARLS